MQIDFPHTTVIFKEPVVYLMFKDGAELDIKEMQELIDAAVKLSDKRFYLLFSDARNTLSITPQARKYAADKSKVKYLIANVVLTDSLANKLMVNFFINFNKPHHPLKMFNNEKDALKWLYSFYPDKTIKVPTHIPKLK